MKRNELPEVKAIRKGVENPESVARRLKLR
jgi:hypothetical protein